MNKTNTQSDLSGLDRLIKNGNAFEESNPSMTPQIAQAPRSLEQQANESAAGKRYSLRSLRCESIEAGPAEHQQPDRVPYTPTGRTITTSDQPCKPRWDNAVSMLLELASDSGDRLVFRFLDDALNEVAQRSVRELAANASSICKLLRSQYTAGSRLILAYSAGLDFIDAFFGCLMAGMIAVPMPLPRKRRRDERFSTVVRDSAAAACLTSHHDRNAITTVQEASKNGFEILETDQYKGDFRIEDSWTPGPEQVAHIQYTSGSTGTPRGVIISHGNLMANLEMIRRGFDFGQSEHLVTWLPHFHDMGLVGDTLAPLYSEMPCTKMAPQSFMREPISWLRAVTKYRATSIGAPNFAYALCARASSPENIRFLDLHSLSHAYCGAEQVHPDTALRFQTAFARSGFNPDAFRPCYGLAEATLCVTVGQARSPLKLRNRPASDPTVTHNSRPVVGCGRPVPDCEVQIFDERADAPLPDGQIGEIVVSGPSVTSGYWGEVNVQKGRVISEEARKPFRTGDLGFLAAGELYVTGRKKDLMIVGGRKLYPQDLERSAISAHIAVEGCAAFAVDANEGEKLVVIAEVSRQYRNGDLSTIRSAIHQAVLDDHEVSIADLVIVNPLSIPRTPSGKIRRFICRENYISQQIQSAIDVSPPPASSEARTSANCDQITDYIRLWASRNLGTERTAITRDSKLSEIGLDSLRVVDLQLALLRDCGLSVSSSAFADGVSIAELSRRSSRFVVPVEPPLAVWPARETVDLRFNVMPGRFVQEILLTKEYRIWNGYAEAIFDRDYQSEMLASPDHLIFLTALAHTQKLAYVYISYEMGLPHEACGAEKFKFWPTDLRVTMPEMVTETTDLRHQLWAYDKRRVAENKYEIKCRSLIGSMEILIDSTMLLLEAK